MAEKQQNWTPGATPNGHLGTYAPQAGMTTAVAGGYPTATFCPATGGAHQPTESTGLMGILIGIFFCPCGLVACCMDKKVTCQSCKYVIKESWGGL